MTRGGECMQTAFWMEARDGEAIYVQRWDSKTPPKLILQLSHGMVEHIGRYDAFATYLTDYGITVYGNDHRGHGQTGLRQGRLGYFSEEQGFEKTTNDLHQLTCYIKKEHPNIPVVLFGHSMGSFFARSYIQTYSDEIDALILSGTGYYTKIEASLGRTLSSFLPPTEPSALMNWLSLGMNNKRIKQRRTKFDWLTSDAGVVQQFANDPLSGYVPTARFFYDLMGLLQQVHDNKNNRAIRNDLPVLLISGNADPVGSYGKGVWKTAYQLTEAGLTNVTTMLFENGRHEMINEKNRNEVYHILKNWLLFQVK